MVEIGKMNQLSVLREVAFGLFLDGGELGDILLPRRYMPSEWNTTEPLDVFLMLDSEDRLTAITEQPLAMVGECAWLRVVSTSKFGAFLDWGLPKDLLVPFREQADNLREGQYCIVRIYLDPISNRIAASTRLDRFLNQEPPTYTPGEKVSLLNFTKTDLGYKMIVNHAHWGILFYNEVFQTLQRGQQLEGYIKNVRPDGKLDLNLQPTGYRKVTDLTDIILNYLQDHNGFMPLTIKHPPEEIYAVFGVSKKTYKQAIGALYKKRLIEFTPDGTKLVVT